MSYRLGVDVGGTFTDLLLFDDRAERMLLAKVPTTVRNPALGIVEGVRRVTAMAGIGVDAIDLFLHGTTVATNAILEAKGVSTALITTAGFRDVLHIMRQDRPRLYDFAARRPDPLVPRRLRFEVAERILHTGAGHRALDEAGVAAIARALRRHKVEAVAVCLLHAYANPVHEQRIREILHKACPDVHVSLSSDVLPEIREYDRTSTTVINAYVVPVMARYLADLTHQLGAMGLHRTVHVMQSSGGIMPSSLAGAKSACTILSGPAAGVLGGLELAGQAGFRNVITVDMGGTSFDICLVQEGKPRFAHDCRIAGHTLKIPMIDIHAIGAGGGSIAWIDAGGALKVGPRSAGAHPGPACYGHGGREPTVTDANLMLGRLNADYFLGGEMDIDPSAAEAAVRERLARPLDLPALDVAEGIIRVVNASMVKGIRFVSVEKGYDPREFGLVCFGGNGPLHASELARELGIPRIVIPFAPGVNCAYGLLAADFRCDATRTCLAPLAAVDLKRLARVFRDMEQPARARMRADGVPAADIEIRRSADLRYAGQGYEIEVPIGSGPLTRRALRESEEAFHVAHRQRYGYRSEEAVELVNVRMACVGHMRKPRLRRRRAGAASPTAARKGTRSVYLGGRFRRTAVYDRASLRPGAAFRGPAIVEQKDSTTLLFPGDAGRIDGHGNILIDVGGST